MKQGDIATIGISKKTKLRNSKLYYKLKQKDIVRNYDNLQNLLIDNYEKGGNKK